MNPDVLTSIIPVASLIVGAALGWVGQAFADQRAHKHRRWEREIELREAHSDRIRIVLGRLLEEVGNIQRAEANAALRGAALPDGYPDEAEFLDQMQKIERVSAECGDPELRKAILSFTRAPQKEQDADALRETIAQAFDRTVGVTPMNARPVVRGAEVARKAVQR